MRTLLTTPVGWSVSALILFWLVQCVRARIRPGGVPLARAARTIPPRAAWVLAWLAVIVPATPLASRALAGSLERLGSDPETMQQIERGPAPDVVIVFAGGLEGDPNPRAPLSDASRERLLAAMTLCSRWPDVPLLISGGSRSGAPITAGMRMVDQARALGFPAARLKLEKSSRTTRENATRTAEWLSERFPDQHPRIVLVTSAGHLARSLASLRRAGYDAEPYASAIPVHSRIGPRSLLPSAAALSRSTAAIHEYLGLAYYAARGWLSFQAPRSETKNAPA